MQVPLTKKNVDFSSCEVGPLSTNQVQKNLAAEYKLQYHELKLAQSSSLFVQTQCLSHHQYQHLYSRYFGPSTNHPQLSPRVKNSSPKSNILKIVKTRKILHVKSNFFYSDYHTRSYLYTIFSRKYFLEHKTDIILLQCSCLLFLLNTASQSNKRDKNVLVALLFA